MDGFVDAFHCGHLGYFCHMQRICDTCLQQSPNDPYLLIWRLSARVLCGSNVDFKSQLESLLQRKETILPAYAVYYLAKKKNIVIGGGSIDDIDSKLKELVSLTHSEKALFHAALLTALLDDDEQKRLTVKLCDIGMSMQPKESVQGALFMNLKSMVDGSIRKDNAPEIFAKDNLWPHYLAVHILKDVDPQKSSDLCSQAMIVFPKQLCFFMLRADIEYRKGSIGGTSEALTELDDLWKTCIYSQKRGGFIETIRINVLSALTLDYDPTKLEYLLKSLSDVVRADEADNLSVIIGIYRRILSSCIYCPQVVLTMISASMDTVFPLINTNACHVRGILYFLQRILSPELFG